MDCGAGGAPAFEGRHLKKSGRSKNNLVTIGDASDSRGKPPRPAIRTREPERQTQRANLPEVRRVAFAVDRFTLRIELHRPARRRVVTTRRRAFDHKAVHRAGGFARQRDCQRRGGNDGNEFWPSQCRRLASAKFRRIEGGEKFRARRGVLDIHTHELPLPRLQAMRQQRLRIREIGSHHRADHEPAEVRDDRVTDQAEVELPEEEREDGLDLQDGERVPEALVPPAAKRDVREVALVLFTAGAEAVGIEAVGIAEVLGDAVRDRRRDDDPASLRDEPVLVDEVLLRDAHEQAQKAADQVLQSAIRRSPVPKERLALVAQDIERSWQRTGYDGAYKPWLDRHRPQF